jgi:Bacterial DNA-binding protein.
MPKKKKEAQAPKKPKMKSVDQLTIAKMISGRTGIMLADVQAVIELEQKYTMDFIKRDCKVIKKNYLTLIPVYVPGKTFKSPLNGKEYTIAAKRGVSVRVGDGFKAYVGENGKKMPEKICRFVDGASAGAADGGEPND